MKAYFSNIVVIFTITFSHSQVFNDNILPYSNLKVNNQLIMYKTLNEVTTLLGNYSSQTTFYNEVEDIVENVYIINNNRFYFYNNELVRFNLQNNNFHFINNSIRVGQNISTLSTVFPNYQQELYWAGEMGVISLFIRDTDGVINEGIVLIITYDTQNIISAIYIDNPS